MYSSKMRGNAEMAEGITLPQTVELFEMGHPEGGSGIG